MYVCSIVSDFLLPYGLCRLPGTSVHGILQARILECPAISFSRGSSQPRDQNRISCIDREILYHWVTWEALQKKASGQNSYSKSKCFWETKSVNYSNRIPGARFTWNSFNTCISPDKAFSIYSQLTTLVPCRKCKKNPSKNKAAKSSRSQQQKQSQKEFYECCLNLLQPVMLFI